MKRFIGKTAIVTGGTRGIGLAITKALLNEGASVLAVYHSAGEAARNLKESVNISATAKQLKIFQADVSVRDDAFRIAERAIADFGRIDILVNNAGVFDFNYLEDMSEEFLNRMIDVNLKGTVFMMQSVLAQMKKQHQGRIVNASSISGHFADVGLIAYASAKAGIDITTRIAAAELGPHGITVNAYAPGIIDTDMTHEMIEERGDVQVRQIPAGYFGSPDDAAGLVLYLCSDDAAYITGEIIGVDGGMMKVQNPYRSIEHTAQENS